VTDHELHPPAAPELAMAELARAALLRWNISTAHVTKAIQLRRSTALNKDPLNAWLS